MDNLESKKLTKEDLENVSGGSKEQIEGIISLLRGRGYLGEYTDRKKELARVNELLNKAGVNALLNDNGNCNHYRIYGGRADHEDLMEHLSQMYPKK